VRGQVSPRTARPYPLTWVCQVLRIPRSSVYAAQAPLAPLGPPGKRGPKTLWGDAEVVAGIRAVLAASPFHGEGYRKVRARLAHRGRFGTLLPWSTDSSLLPPLRSLRAAPGLSLIERGER